MNSESLSEESVREKMDRPPPQTSILQKQGASVTRAPPTFGNFQKKTKNRKKKKKKKRYI